MVTILWKSIGAGLLGGLAGAFAMNQFGALVKAVSSSEDKSSSKGSGDDATVKAAKAISEAVFQHQLRDNEKQWAGPAVHYSTGAIAGIIYGAATQSIPAASWGAGMAYGTAVWLVGDEVAVPALGFSGPPSETPLSGHVTALASHWVYGVVTFTVRKILVKS